MTKIQVKNSDVLFVRDNRKENGKYNVWYQSLDARGDEVAVRSGKPWSNFDNLLKNIGHDILYECRRDDDSEVGVDINKDLVAIRVYAGEEKNIQILITGISTDEDIDKFVAMLDSVASYVKGPVTEDCPYRYEVDDNGKKKEWGRISVTGESSDSD